MPRLPITDPSASRSRSEETRPILSDASEYDAVLGVYTLFVLVPRVEVVYFRLVVESWEDFAVVRTMQRFCEDDRSRSVVVVMAVPDFIEPCAKGLARLCTEVEGVQVPSTRQLREALRRDLLDPAPSGVDVG
jgi:hypothetical protein